MVLLVLVRLVRRSQAKDSTAEVNLRTSVLRDLQVKVKTATRTISMNARQGVRR